MKKIEININDDEELVMTPDGTYKIQKIKPVSNWGEYEKYHKYADAGCAVIAPIELKNAFIAFGKLMCLHKEWVKDWKPDWKSTKEPKYIIEIWTGNMNTNTNLGKSSPLSFPTSRMRDEFLITFKDLILEAKELL